MNTAHPVDKLKALMTAFLAADLARKLEIARMAATLHPRLQHYTSLNNLLKMIKHRELWLTRSDSLTLDDWNECRKFGGGRIHGRTFIGCFSHHSGESAAMWGLYCTPDSQQVKFSIPSDIVSEWVSSLQDSKDQIYAVESILGEKIEDDRRMPVESIELADILYASVKGGHKGEKSRDGFIRLDGVLSSNKFDSSDVVAPSCTARMKDVEWDFEEETRLIVGIKSTGFCSAVRRIRIPLPQKVIANMAFTLSPWLPEEQVREYRAMLRLAVRESVDSNVLGKHRIGIYRSTLCGALGKWASVRTKK